MTTQRQIDANKQNALLSTGPVTQAGKNIVANNAIKHGIFTKDLIIAKGDGKENGEAYKELLNNLIQCLHPEDQMELLLVEKIAVDFWRLRRVIRFETGSIRKHLDTVIYDYYNQTDWDGKKLNRANDDIDNEIAEKRKPLKWNNAYIKCLKKGIVSFDKPVWKGKNIESDIENDLYSILKKLSDEVFDEDSFARFIEGEMDFDEMRGVLSEHGYKDKEISRILIDSLNEENEGYKKAIYNLEMMKYKNKVAEEANIKIFSLPSANNADKVIKYEKSIQKSIFQNLAILKKLQSLP